MTSPFILSTRDLGRQAGSMREVETTVSADVPFGSDVIAIPAGAPIELDLRLEAVSEGVLVTGTARAVAKGQCVRCLRDVEEEIEVDITELFGYPGSRHERRAEQPEEDDPLPTLDGDMLDLEPTVTDALVPALPFQPLCTPDCGGLCAVCGIRLDDAEPGHAHEVIDPRWAALSALASPREEGESTGQAGS